MNEFIQLIRATTRIDVDIEPDTPLISSGFIDSFDVVSLLAVFEGRYGVAIAPEDIDVEGFDTAREMLAHIEAVRN